MACQPFDSTCRVQHSVFLKTLPHFRHLIAGYNLCLFDMLSSLWVLFDVLKIFDVA